MSSFTDSADCPKNCWIMGAVIGAVLFLVFWLLAGWSFLWALIAGLIIFIAVPFILQMLLCTEGDASANASPQSVARPAAAPTSASPAASPQPAAPAAEPDPAPMPDPEPVAADLEPVVAEAESDPEPVAAEPEPEAAPEPVAAEPEEDGASQQPAALSAARDGGADDLKRIKGVGPKLELLLHSLGIFHFDQIADWGPSEVAWMDDNLAGFKGRVTRDTWVAQAGLLAAGDETDFSRKVDDGTVY